MARGRVVQFAAPVHREKYGEVIRVRHDPPDRWWATDARTGILLSYALSTVEMPRGASNLSAINMPASSTLEELRYIRRNFARVMDAIVPAFFNCAVAAPEAVEAAAIFWAQRAFAPLIERYHTAAPDFFAWIGARMGAAPMRI